MLQRKWTSAVRPSSASRCPLSTFSLLLRRENRRAQLGTVGLLWHDLKRWWYIKRTRRRDPIPIWRTAIKTIEGHFGTGQASFFVFVRWLFLLNTVQAVAYSCFVVLPMAVRYDYAMANSTFEWSNVFDGQGAVGNSWLFYGVRRHLQRKNEGEKQRERSQKLDNGSAVGKQPPPSESTVNDYSCCNEHDSLLPNIMFSSSPALFLSFFSHSAPSSLYHLRATRAYRLLLQSCWLSLSFLFMFFLSVSHCLNTILVSFNTFLLLLSYSAPSSLHHSRATRAAYPDTAWTWFTFSPS